MARLIRLGGLLSVMLLATALSFSPQSVEARGTVRSGTSGYERISKGVIDLGLDNTLLTRYSKAGSASTLNLSYFGGITGRYFVVDNLGVGASLNGFYAQDRSSNELGGASEEVTASDRGVIAFLTVDYFARLGHSFFVKPGLGGGMFYGWRTLPAAQGLKLENTLVGGAGRLNLALVYYASSHLNLKAGADVIVRVGNEKPSDERPGGDEGERFTSVEAGFSIGVGYSF